MRACVQRVTEARVAVDGEVVAEIGPGIVALIGVAAGDTEDDARYLAGKICELRIFDDEAGKMNRSLRDVGGALLAVSQFTLLGDCRKGRRPSYTDAAEPLVAEQLFEEFVNTTRSAGVDVKTGRFRAHMQVSLVNDGPVTLLLDSRRKF